MTIEDRILADLVKLDEGVNGILGGDPEQTISARAYAVELAGVDSFWRVAIDRLFYEGHCKAAWEHYMAEQAQP